LDVELGVAFLGPMIQTDLKVAGIGYATAMA
jgi:hypothetical protein